MRRTLRRCLFVAIVAGIAAPAWMLAADEDQKASNDDKEAVKQMWLHASKAYKSTVEVYETGVTDSEDVYRWSLRLMKAEQRMFADRKSEAAKEHYLRMSRHLANIRELNRHDARGGETRTLAAAEFYVAEARHFLTAATAE